MLVYGIKCCRQQWNSVRMLNAPYLLALSFSPAPNPNWREKTCGFWIPGYCSTLRNLCPFREFLLLGSKNCKLPQSYIPLWDKPNWDPCALSRAWQMTQLTCQEWRRQDVPFVSSSVKWEDVSVLLGEPANMKMLCKL